MTSRLGLTVPAGMAGRLVVETKPSGPTGHLVTILRIDPPVSARTRVVIDGKECILEPGMSECVALGAAATVEVSIP